MKDMQADILIIGSGLSGLTLAAVLAESGADVIVADREKPVTQLDEKYDGRTTAISYASHQVLKAAGAWELIEKDCEPILDIRVADGNAPLFLHFATDADANGEPFGWIIENNILRRRLFDNLQRFENVRHLAPVEIRDFFNETGHSGVVLKDGRRLSAPLLVGADGRASPTRAWLDIGVSEWTYKQAAVVCNAAHELDHENVAVEHFLPDGPFAILPMTRSAEGEHRSSVVWTVEEKQAAKILKFSGEKFDAELQKLFGEHLGRVRHVSKPMAYPLRLLHAKKYTGPRAVLMAEAAHVIHPIAGQGLNLSMRDIAVLAEIVVDRLKLGLDPGSAGALTAYEQWRRSDTLLMAGFTDVLNRLFSNNLKSIAVIRDLGIGIVDKVPPLKGFFARQAMGLGGKSPRIVRDGRL